MKNPSMWPDLTLPPINLHNMPNTTEQPSLSPTAYAILEGWMKGQLEVVANSSPPSDWMLGYGAALKNLKSLLIDLEGLK